MRQLTVYLAKLMGLYALVVSVWLVAEPSAVLALGRATVADPVALFIIGLVTLGAGLAVVVGHNHWSGGVLPVLVTVIGWLLTARGVALICVPGPVLARMLVAIHYGDYTYAYAAVPFALGAYFAYAGFIAERRKVS